MNKKVPIKNYIILGFIFVLTILVTIYLCNVYTVYEESKRQIPVIRDTLYEINSEELEHYISENPTTMIYMCTPANQTCRNYEKDLKRLVTHENLQDELIYLNLTEEEFKNFSNTFNSKYNKKLKLNDSYPAIVIFEDGMPTYILQGKAQEKLTIAKTKQFLDLHKIGE